MGVVALTLGLAGEAWPGSGLFGLGMGDVGATFAASTAVVPTALGVVAVRLRAVRDVGAALLAPASDRRPHLHLLSSCRIWDSTRP